jgi:hypothetical protein
MKKAIVASPSPTPKIRNAPNKSSIPIGFFLAVSGRFLVKHLGAFWMLIFIQYGEVPSPKLSSD